MQVDDMWRESKNMGGAFVSIGDRRADGTLLRLCVAVNDPEIARELEAAIDAMSMTGESHPPCTCDVGSCPVHQ